jgi:hypothetical protein
LSVQPKKIVIEKKIPPQQERKVTFGAKIKEVSSQNRTPSQPTENPRRK